MAKKSIVPLIGVVALIAIVGGMNIVMQKHTIADTSDDDDDDNQPAQTQKAPAAPASRTATPTYVANTASTAPPSEAVVGDPNAKSVLTVGYTWTPGLQVKQNDLKQIIAGAEGWASQPGRQVQIVCVDVPADQRQYPQDANVPVGVTLSGKPVPGLGGNPGESFPAESFDKALPSWK